FQLLAAQPELAVVLDRDHQIGLGLVQGGDGLAESGLEGFALFGGGGDGGAQVDKGHGVIPPFLGSGVGGQGVQDGQHVGGVGVRLDFGHGFADDPFGVDQVGGGGGGPGGLAAGGG